MTHAERWKTTFCLYFNYLIHGMAIVILAQNMLALSRTWHVDMAGVSLVISSLGIGRLLVLYLAGSLSDRWGRRIFVKIGILTYMGFFIGILISPNIYVAYFFGILAGMANSFLDSGTYPALMELYPQHQATANIMIKAFASIGELILPLLVAGLEGAHLWYGWSFVICAVGMAVSFMAVRHRQFAQPGKVTATETAVAPTSRMTTAHKRILAVTLTLFGYVSMATFYLISQWLTEYGSRVVHLTMMHARMLVSIYSIGSIFGVVVTAILVERWLQPVWFMLLDTVVSLVALVLMAAVPTQTMMRLGAFLIGCFAAGGVMQIGLTIMGNVFPQAKGKITGIYYTASGLASFTIPVITAVISQHSVRNLMWFDAGLAVVGVLCSLITVTVYRQERIDESVVSPLGEISEE
ncbi:MFS transporter [Levilactobacillus acidifarinae]|uniref:MFS family major facilitator transporter n=1 Tax=Levilactobacillus acidifarinae DSM 19394 = JCM 15949 TaxID=1423715 RepID=A0A0R1LJ19_9LACO|nr:MFS transporter [Levilactobacillus acidifarinae]KRK95837.1 MFS family major facilitator transporter [Levilactobacillus acidifarinae DSM 19394]GEO69135.1 MFS transporter [Levilactobacillus acidifarinae]